jgi:hypothetical protein
VLRSAAVLGALGYRGEVLAPEQGLSLRGPADDQLLSGEGRRQRWVKLAHPVDPTAPLRLPPDEPRVAVHVRQRASRRAVKGAVAAAEAEARAPRVAATLMDGDHAQVGPSLWRYARVGPGRGLPIGDPTPGEVPLETGPSACHGGGEK